MSVINGVTDAVVGSIPVGGYPWGVAYDGGNGYLYVANMNSGNVSVINGATDTVVGSIPVGVQPDAVAYDSGNGYLYVTNEATDNMNVINGATDTVVGSITVGLGPTGVAYDSGNGYLYVANWNSGNVSVINGATDTVVGSITSVSEGDGMAFDGGNGYLYVTNQGFSISNSTVSVINGSTDAVVGSVTVGNTPEGVAYDSGNGYLYVANSNCPSSPCGQGNVSVINGVTGTVVGSVPVGNNPYGVGYDSGNGYLYVTNFAAGSLSIITSGPAPRTYPVTFSESGLASGTNWSMTLAGQTLTSSSSTILFNDPNGTYSFSVGAVAGYTDNITSGSLTVNGASVSRSITFSPVTYPVTFFESGLPSGTSWSVAVNGSTNGSTTASIGFTEPNGTYVFGVGAVSGYMATPSSGSLSVNGAPQTVSITFTPSTAATYAVTCSESGLPSGTNWSVTLNGATRSSTTNTIVFTEPNGTYAFTVGGVAGYTVSPSSGSVTVNGRPVSVLISFTPLPGTYSVTFTESGLISGTSWSVAFNGTHQSSTTTSIVFSNALNGTYNFGVGAVTGYSVTPSSGSVTINGANTTQPVTFTPLQSGRYSVTFSESGLSSGTTWLVTFNGKTQSSTTTSIVFSNYPNGTYTYTVGVVAGYTANITSGSVTISGASKSVSITYTPSTAATYAVTFSESGLSSGTSWSVTLNGATKSGTGNVAFTDPNGTYPFSVGAIAGYTAAPSSGSIPVNGAAVSKSITFTALTQGQYSLIFSETGLPAGTNWSVTVGSTTHSSTASTVSFTEMNGTYHYFVGAVSGYTSAPSSGSVTVNGAAKTLAVTFSKSITGTTYAVTFSESGLPPGTSWSVSLNGNTQAGTGSLVFTEPNGSYPFTVGGVASYTANITSGSVPVNGGPVSRSITFTPAFHVGTTYAVTFSESGLTSGTSWSVTLSGNTLSSTTPTITLQELNGSYTFSVGTVSGYAVSPSYGTVRVDGGPADQSLTFTGSSSTGQTNQTTGFLGLPGSEGYVLIVAIVAVVAAVVVAVLLARKRKGGQMPTGMPPTSSPPVPQLDLDSRGESPIGTV